MAVNRNTTRFAPSTRSSGCVPTSSPFTNRRTVAGCATVEVMSALTWICSPTRAVDGAVSRSTMTSSAPPRPVRCVSTWMPRAAASAASVCPEPVVSLPSREQDDALLGVVREQRRGEAQRGADVGGALDGRRRDPVDLREVGRQPLHEGIPAERHDARDVLVLLRRQALPQVRERLLAAGGADRVGEVDHVDHGEAIDGQDELEPGQREDEGGEQQRADDERGPPSAGPDAGAASRGAARSPRRSAGGSRRSASGASKLKPITRPCPPGASRAAVTRRRDAGGRSVSRS